MKRVMLLAIGVPLAAVSVFSQPAMVSIADHGAVGDGKTTNTTAIQSVIDSVAKKGGGTVFVPAGVFMTGTLQLRSNVELHLDQAAVLKGTTNLADYILNGKRVGILFTQDAVNVSITGSGTIDGDGDSFMELGKAKTIENAGVAFTRQKEGFRKISEGIGDGPVVPRDRPYQMIIFSDCRSVTVRNVRLFNSPFWTLHFADCDGVIVSGVRIWANLLIPNNDGVDFTSCSNVQMSDCDIRTGDDCIAVTGYSHHFELPGYKDLRHPCENITVTNCTLVSRSAGIRIGGFDQNPMRNLLFNNITITNSNRGIGIFGRDEGGIENLVFSNMVIETRLHTGDWWGNAEPIHVSAVRLTKGVRLGKVKNIRFENIICRGESGILVFGSEENLIEDVTFRNVSLHLRESPLNALSGGNIDLRPALEPTLQLFAHDIPAVYAHCVKGFTVDGFTLTWGDVQEPFFTHGLEVSNFEGVRIEGFRGEAAPRNQTASPVLLRDGKGVEISGAVPVIRRQNVR